MEHIGVYEAKTHLPKLLERIQSGERITITRHGTPVAVLLPFPGAARQPVDQVIAALRQFGRRGSLKGLSIKDMIAEGRG
jgi:prevent-host-death family protein